MAQNLASTSAPESTLVPAVERAVENVVGIGRLWTTQGLEMGRAILATSAESLRLLSQTLDEAKSHVQGDARAK